MTTNALVVSQTSDQIIAELLGDDGAELAALRARVAELEGVLRELVPLALDRVRTATSWIRAIEPVVAANPRDSGYRADLAQATSDRELAIGYVRHLAGGLLRMPEPDVAALLAAALA